MRAYASLVVTSGVLALKVAMVHGALLSKHHWAPFLSEEEYRKISTFRAINSWRSKSAWKFKLTSITLHGEAGDVDPSQHEECMNTIHKIVNEFGPTQAYNMDEMGLMYKCLQN